MASKKGKRYVWQERETATLLDLYISHKAVLEGPYSAVITKELKKKTWVLLTESLHMEHPDCSEKTVDNVKKKWNNFPTAAKSTISNHKQGLTETDGGPSTGPLRDIYMKFWEEILGKDNPTVAGMTIPGSIDSEVVGDGSVVDRSLVQLILNSDGNNHEDSSNDDEEMEGGLTQDKLKSSMRRIPNCCPLKALKFIRPPAVVVGPLKEVQAACRTKIPLHPFVDPRRKHRLGIVYVWKFH